MTEKRFTLHKGLDTFNIMDNTKFREQIYINKSSKDMKCLVGLLNELAEENNELKKQLEREETDKKRLMSYLMRYKGFGFDEIVDDYFNEPYYDNWWEDGFYECCWDEYLKEKGFDGCDEE